MAQTPLELGRDSKRQGAKLGLICVLHTWIRALDFPPHVRCVVTGGGGHRSQRWIDSSRKSLFPLKVMATLFRIDRCPSCAYPRVGLV